MGVKSASRSFRKVAMASGNCDGGSFECTLSLLPFEVTMTRWCFLSDSTLEVQRIGRGPSVYRKAQHYIYRFSQANVALLG